MRPSLALAVLLTLSAGCQSARPSEAAAASEAATSPSHIEEIRPGVWVHATYREVEGFGRVLSNGLAVASGSGALLIDAGWSDDPEAATAAILAEVEAASGAPVRRAVVSHHHEDSVAGIEAFRLAGIPTYAAPRTADLMAAAWGSPDSVFADGEAWTLTYGDQEVEVFYGGPGHTVDNVVVYVPSARVLYGGCLIRPGTSASLGNTADADIERWAESVARVRDRYQGRVEVVVPSHGAPGGPELLDHTIDLVETHRGRPVGG